MKMVVAYIEREGFEPIREELLALGFASVSAWEASGTTPEALVHGSYRGASIETHMRPKVRMECVAGEEHVQTIVDTVLKHAGEHRFVFVLAVESVFPLDTVKAGEPAVSA